MAETSRPCDVCDGTGRLALNMDMPTAPTTTAATPEELATITVRYRLPRSEAQAVMLDERARQISWDDVFAERDAQRAEIERLTKDVERLLSAAGRTSYHPDACPITGRPFFMTIDGKATYGGPFDSYTIPRRDDDGSLTCERYDHDRGAWRENEGLWLHVVSEEDLAERDEKLEAAEADISAAHQALTDARIPVIDDDMRVLGLDERVRTLAAERDGMADTIPSLIAVVGKLTGAPMDDPAGYGIDDCVAMLEEHEAAVAGIGWQIGLTGETERADRAEARTAAAVSDASRHERLWRAAMRGLATYRVLLAASRERERKLTEALEKCAAAFEQPLTGIEEAALNAARAALKQQETADGAKPCG